MMLHGPTGVGKNYITRTLANSMYTQGTNSVFIHYMTSAVHFTSDDSIKTHISELQNWIEGYFDWNWKIFNLFRKLHNLRRTLVRLRRSKTISFWTVWRTAALHGSRKSRSKTTRPQHLRLSLRRGRARRWLGARSVRKWRRPRNDQFTQSWRGSSAVYCQRRWIGMNFIIVHEMIFILF